ncbi:hypothetical protein C0Q70_08135 [Pomacea canaliculata]|uniref:Exocyst complex component 3 n=1 Tax=Pomacea canaliculata TaxID=400727 RepID=A0A2T7PH30_POMCA|nr:hypothetical protein C0Q70_08135 [Pomacea canaliculata]
MSFDEEPPPDARLGPAPAPLDLGRLEVEARAAAAKHVASLLQRPDQLEKVDQYKRRVARKKASVEAMLKTAVQSQLDGVRTGLNQLQSALQDVYEIKHSLDQVEEAYKAIDPLHKVLKPLMEENSKFCSLTAAQENLKHIFTVPESVKKTRDLISEGKLLQAHKHLTDLERSRDDLLLELHKQPHQSPTDKHMLNQYFAEVQELSKELGKQLWVIIQRMLISVRREPTLIVTALRIIEREERMDAAWMKKKDHPGFMPPGRPKKWRDQCFKVLEQSIAAKMEGSQLESRDENKMWLVRHLEILRQLMIDDLKVVKTLLPPVCPPEYNVVKRYTTMYHKGLSQHLQELIHQELEGNEIVSLLQWVGAYDSPELMRHPDVNIDVKDLGPLLEQDVIRHLQNQYMKNMGQNISEWSRNTLRSDVKDWLKAEEPEADGDGYYNTQLPVIIFQMMEQNLQVAQIISQELVKNVLELFTFELNRFATEYKNEIKIYRERHMADRKEPKFFVHYMIANINNCLSFGEYMRMLRRRYLKNDEYEEEGVEEDTEMIRKDRFQQLTEQFLAIGNECCGILLDELHTDLKESNCINELMTRWPTQMLWTLYATWADYAQDFVHIKPRMFESLVQEGQKRILREYLRALLSRHRLCPYDKRTTFASLEGNQFDVLPALAEVLRLRDTSMLSLEVTGFAQKYPDIRMEQLINLILCRGDISRADAKQFAMDTLGEEDLRPKPKGIFTDLGAG